MSHEHSVRDVDKRFSINTITKIVTAPESNIPVFSQYDHNSEHITFEVDRFVEGHDLSKCDKVEVHYNNTAANGRAMSKGFYEAVDLGVDSSDDQKVIFTWIISDMATQHAGKINFIVSFVCTDEGDVLYRWNTKINSDLIVSDGINNVEYVEERYADVLEMWKRDLFGIGDTEEARMIALSESLQETMESKGNRVLNTIPDEYVELDKKVDEATWILEAVENKIPLECSQVRSSPSESITASVVNDDYNTIFKWNAPYDASYVYTFGRLGTYKEFKNKTIRVVIRNESDNAASLDELEILLSKGRDWGNVPKTKPIPVGVIENGDTVAIDIAVGTVSTWDINYKFEDDDELFFILRDCYIATHNNNNVLRFYCVELDDTQKFETAHNLSEVYSANHSDKSTMSAASIEAGVRIPKKGSIKTYKNTKDEDFGYWSYNESNHTARLTLTRRDNRQPNTTDGTGTYHWLYGMLSVNVSHLLGTGAKFYVDFSSKEYTYNELISTLNFKYYLSPTYHTWASIYTRKHTPESKNIAVDLDTMELTKGVDESKPVYLSFAYEVKVAPNDSGLCTTPKSGTIDIKLCYTLPNDGHVFATKLYGFDQSDYYTKSEVDSRIDEVVGVEGAVPYITCWGDSLTAQGGWTTRLSELTGMTVYNGGTGGENVKTIVARQGADAITLNDITIPAGTSAVTLATRSGDTGLTTEAGNKVTPLLQGGNHVNPCKIGDVLGTLKWTGNSYADTNGTWTFTRQTAGSAVTINRPTALRTDFDMTKNAPYLMVIFMGQNGGYTDIDDLIRWHRLMINHAKAKHVIVLGLSSGSASSRADYEAAMKKEFGRYFISLREYLSKYGLADQSITPTAADNTAMSSGTVPPSCLSDAVHFTAGTRTVIGDLIYRRCRDLNIF